MNKITFRRNRIIAVCLSTLAVVLCGTSCRQQPQPPRIAIAGIAIECSTFSPATSDESMFRVKKDSDLLHHYPFLAADSVLRQKAQWFPAMYASATPGGIVTREAYESLVGQIIDRLKQQLPYDGVFLDIHGAMSVQGMDDPESDFLRRVREAVGNATLISTCMDLHGNPSQNLTAVTDLVTCYRMAPHEDSMDSKRRAAANLVERLETGAGKPRYKAWVKVPVLLPGEKTSTRVEPGKSLYAKVAPAAAQPGVTDAAIWIGYAWADEPRNHGTVIVTGDDRQQVEASALELARSFWEVRRQFEFVAPTADLEDCLAVALKSDKRPFFISDMGDNPTAGGAGDVTWTLTQLAQRKEFSRPGGKTLVYASIPGPEVVEKAFQVGVGQPVEGEVGARVDHRYAPPFPIKGVVVALGDKRPGNREAVIQQGGMKIIVTEKRTGFHYAENFTDLGIDPAETDIIVVKLGYLTKGLYDIRGDWMMALTRGGVDQDLLKLEYRRIERPMFPFDVDMEDPDFQVNLVPVCQ